MADNVSMGSTTALVAADEVSYSGDTSQVQLMRLVGMTGAEGSKTVTGDLIPAPQSVVPIHTASGVPVRNIGSHFIDCSFHAVGSGLLASEMTQLRLGTGVTVSQASGSLVIAASMTANAEFLARSNDTFSGAFQFSASFVASQRIANNNFAFVLADLIGENLAYTINSATSISVTKTAHGFTAQNVGQGIFIGALTVAGSVPGRYVIASIPDANTINFTVSGFPASGSGTCTLFGWNHYSLWHSGTTATNVLFNSQRRGWRNADVTATINTTASPGTIEYINAEGSMAYMLDRTRASASTNVATSRASFSENIPTLETPLHVFLWSFNGTTAPASSTTWTISFFRVEDYSKLPVQIAGNNHMGSQSALPVFMAISPTIAAGSNQIGDVSGGVRTTTGGLTSNSRIPSAAGTTNGTVAKASAGRLYKIRGHNAAAAVRYLKLHNSTTVTPGTTAVTHTFALPAGQAFDIDFGLIGLYFATGICYSLTTGAADNDTGALTAGDILGLNVIFA